ncbi:LysR family transcriptional regulator [Paracidovorax citrulli]|uniref:Transcriptional regulator, LysR family n=2 Tax=Paracidovorax citrulli TaxID=80869 RepID=A1TN54_PARC0|nr:LysR family transcriptional regulator [Paracidovorax citrulli]ABM32392.1 transcriptional regulator, LysR family [Paracidovorax citrulli AAC00-1]ATG94589.1 LysR family transcriptional regulator [Paracidovorax citrulli]MVT28488.1 LysR family transcriptional regulator [Paracidovorax citrulli]MVT38662.1 LysR family transcriptional regulator [Paracidovorax citrulli]PVY66608.1 LysR family transcriptional regulator [Paracidovorax citrulli]
MDRLTAMRVFVEVVDRGSVSAAAEAMDMSRAMASRYLEGLENWLGARLLHRTTRRITLTDAGQTSLVTCREMLVLANDVMAQAGQGSTQAHGRLRLTSSSSFAMAQLTGAVVDFQALHPKVDIDLVMVDRTVDLVQERIDLAVRLSNAVDPVLVARRLASCYSVLCASPAYLERAGAPKTPEDLQVHQCILHNAGFAPEYRLRRAGEWTTVAVRGAITANETSVVRAAALAGAGIAMLPTYFVGDSLADGTLRKVLPEYALEPLDIQAVYLSRRHQPLPLRLLIDFLADRFGGEVAPWDRLPLPA